MIKRWSALSCFLLLLPLAGFSQTSTPSTTAERLQLPASNDGLPGAGPVRRDHWFRKLWTQRRSVWAQQVVRDQHAVVFVGDASIQSWGNDLRGEFPALKIANRGINGDTTRGVLIRLNQDVLALRPKAVVLCVGSDDLAQNATLETTVENLARIVARLAEHGATMPIVVCQAFPNASSRNIPNERFHALNDGYARRVGAHPQVSFVKTMEIFTGGMEKTGAEKSPDHLPYSNEALHKKWAALLRPILESAPPTAEGVTEGN